MHGFLNEFKKFIMRGNVIDLAIGVIIGAAFGKIVESVVADIIMPVVGLLTGGFNISHQSFQYREAVVRWGNFLQTVVNFVIIGFCLFLVIKGMNVLQARFLREEAAKPQEPPATPTEKLLAEIRDLLKDRPLPTSEPGTNH